MRIGIDARLLKESGIGRYLRNLLTELQDLDKENDYYVFLLKKDFDLLKLNSNFHKVEANFSWYTLAEQIKFPKLLNTYNLDVTHFPHFNVPIFYKGKFIVTIHDLIHQHFSMERATTHGKLLYAIKKIGYRKVFGHAVKASIKIIVPSQYVKEDLQKEYRIDSSKILVTYEGVEKSFFKILDTLSQKEINQTLDKYNVRPPFLFYLGNAHPHKNVEGLIEAFLRLRQKYQYLSLVLAGNDHYFWRRLQKEYVHQDIHYLGFVSDKEMVALYKTAQVRVVPSFEEGFGIPVLEAFACGCPVACSNTSSLPEVAGSAAVYFDPKNISDMEQKIHAVLDNLNLRKQIITAGRERVKQFSWQKMAQQTLQQYQKVGQSKLISI